MYIQVRRTIELRKNRSATYTTRRISGGISGRPEKGDESPTISIINLPVNELNSNIYYGKTIIFNTQIYMYKEILIFVCNYSGNIIDFCF